MGNVKELSNEETDLHKSGNWYKNMDKHTTNRRFKHLATVANLPGRGRKCMLSVEDGEGGKKEPKDHCSRTADFSCVLGSQSLKINHKTPLPYQQALWKGCTKKALTERNQQIQASGVIGTMTGTGCYGQMRPKWNFLAMFGQTVGMSACLVSKEKCIQGKAPLTYCQIWWRITDALGPFCCQWSRGSC